MDINQIISLLAGNVPAVVFAVLWWSERRDRKELEHLYRDTLRTLAKLPTERQAGNGDTMTP